MLSQQTPYLFYLRIVFLKLLCIGKLKSSFVMFNNFPALFEKILDLPRTPGIFPCSANHRFHIRSCGTPKSFYHLCKILLPCPYSVQGRQSVFRGQPLSALFFKQIGYFAVTFLFCHSGKVFVHNPIFVILADFRLF